MSDITKINGYTIRDANAASPLTIYPVGAIYLSVDSTNPSTLFGGTWEAIGGRFLLGADSSYKAGTTGGEATHTLTIQEMPKHTHTYTVASSMNYNWGNNGWGGVWLWGTDANTTAVGGDQPHNNMPPYIVVYMWKRTA